MIQAGDRIERQKIQPPDGNAVRGFRLRAGPQGDQS